MMNFGKMLKQAQEMQTKMAELQQRLAEAEVSGAAGGGLVNVVMTGKGAVKQVKIDPSLAVPGEVEVLEDLVVAALNDARAKADALSQEEMQKLTGGLNLPPGMKLPF